MATADELLNNLVLEHEHSVTDPDTYFRIDPVSRKLENAADDTNVLMQYDHCSEIYTFELPRYVEGHDMMLCNSVLVHWNNIDAETKTETTDVSDVTDLRINPENEETVICSWSPTRHSTQLVGILSFLVQYKCIAEDGTVTYEWHTDIYENVEVRKGRNNGPQSIIDYTDILEQWRVRLFGASSGEQQKILDLSSEQQAILAEKTTESIGVIDERAAEILATIPEDYQETYKNSEESVRTKADAIVQTTHGAQIAVIDASDDHLRGLRFFGKTRQFTTTGKNLVDLSDFEFDDSDYIHSYVYTSSTTANALFNFLKANVGQTVTLSAVVTGTASGVDIGQIRFYDENDSLIYMLSPGVSTTIDEKTAEFKSCYVYGSTTGASAAKFQLEYGTEVTEWEPYTGGIASPNPDYPQELISIDESNVYISGKNLFDMGRIKSTDTITILNNGTISVSHYYNQTQITLRVLAPGLTVGAKVVLNLDTDGATFIYLSKYGRVWDSGGVLVVTDDILDSHVCLYGLYEQTEGSTIIRSIQIAVVGQSTEYEPYSESQIITAPYLLRGIPVLVHGNYTDENGQQWVCDEVDFDRGVYIQRCFGETVSFTLQEDLNRYSTTITHRANPIYATYQGIPVLSDTHIFNGNCGSGSPMVNGIRISASSPNYAIAYHNGDVIESAYILYPLETPIETPLATAEIEAFKAVYSRYPNTTVLNDSGAEMEVTYNADTKLYINNYIDESFAEALEEILNGSY